MKHKWAITLAENETVYQLVRDCGFPIICKTHEGETTRIITLYAL